MKRRLELLWRWLELEQEKIYKIALLALIILLSLALGYIFAGGNQPAPIIIERTAVTDD